MDLLHLVTVVQSEAYEEEGRHLLTRFEAMARGALADTKVDVLVRRLENMSFAAFAEGPRGSAFTPVFLRYPPGGGLCSDCQSAGGVRGLGFRRPRCYGQSCTGVKRLRCTDWQRLSWVS